MVQVETNLPEVFLLPGEVCLARKPAVIRTILGSCVGITFWSARLGAGALCHALLPRCPNASKIGTKVADGYRYVDFAVRDLARRFGKLGVQRSELQVKVFGGADVLPVSDPEAQRATIGRQNCETALEALRAEGFEVTASSLGGTSGRSIQFFTATGEVRLRWIAHSVCTAEIAAEELPSRRSNR
jgi:chemotaxis protein CheD